VNTAQIAPPWGIKQVVPLLKSHRVRLTETGMAPQFSIGLHAVPLVASEFSVALRDYPIVFLRRPQDGAFEAMAILGIHEGQNMFVMPDGRWDRRTYIPAYIRRYPFSMTAASAGGAERMVCVDPQALSDNGAPLFDAAGTPLPLWTEIRSLLNEYEDELARTRQLSATLQQLGVLAPFSLHADLASGFSLSLDGLHRVDRAKLAALDLQALRGLIAGAEMDWIYAHLMAQDNFLRLLARRGMFAQRAAA
jgi:hypothetical protein